MKQVRLVMLALLVCALTIPAIAQRGRGAGPAARPNMLDDADVTLRPPWSNSPDLVPNPNAPRGTIHRFTMKSTDSKIYKGISRDNFRVLALFPANAQSYLVA